MHPLKILEIIHGIEEDLGRTRSSHGTYESRTIDIDILFYDEKIVQEPSLKIPHPLVHKRRFALVPLVEISPDFIHPLLKETMSALLDKCEDPISVTPVTSIPTQ